MGMMINRRRGYGGKKGLLPSGYKQLEYIESTGTQYIDTGLNYIAGDEFGLIYQQVTLDSYYRSLFGAANDGGLYKLYISQTNYDSWVGNYQDGANIIPRDENRHTLSWMPTSSSVQNIVIDGITLAYNASIISNPNLNVMVFGRNSKDAKMIGKFYGYYQKRNGEYLINLIPAKNSNNIIGMYDTVSGQFFTNAGTGAFIEGPGV